MALLEVDNLRTHFRTRGQVNRSVDGLSFHVEAGETLPIVGESGCGKSVTAMSIMRLIVEGQGKSDGAIRFDGRDLLTLSEREMQTLRGNRMSMIFQDPMTSLNPVLTVGWQLGETLRLHQKMSRAGAREHALKMLRLVRIAEPERRIDQYPHELSGGMRQRVMIAMALACEPQLLIADEPTTALDVTVQAQILELLRQLRETMGSAIILITHDLGVVAEMAHRVVVMYAGRKVEEAGVRELFARPMHPYTQALLKSMPRLSDTAPAGDRAPQRLTEIPGVVPALVQEIPGCVFAPRCSYAVERCHRENPALVAEPDGHAVACWETRRTVEAIA